MSLPLAAIKPGTVHNADAGQRYLNLLAILVNLQQHLHVCASVKPRPLRLAASAALGPTAKPPLGTPQTTKAIGASEHAHAVAAAVVVVVVVATEIIPNQVLIIFILNVFIKKVIIIVIIFIVIILFTVAKRVCTKEATPGPVTVLSLVVEAKAGGDALEAQVVVAALRAAEARLAVVPAAAKEATWRIAAKAVTLVPPIADPPVVVLRVPQRVLMQRMRNGATSRLARALVPLNHHLVAPVRQQRKRHGPGPNLLQVPRPQELVVVAVRVLELVVDALRKADWVQILVVQSRLVVVPVAPPVKGDANAVARQHRRHCRWRNHVRVQAVLGLKPHANLNHVVVFGSRSDLHLLHLGFDRHV